jgi:hypothetical protein
MAPHPKFGVIDPVKGRGGEATLDAEFPLPTTFHGASDQPESPAESGWFQPVAVVEEAAPHGARDEVFVVVLGKPSLDVLFVAAPH